MRPELYYTQPAARKILILRESGLTDLFWWAACRALETVDSACVAQMRELWALVACIFAIRAFLHSTTCHCDILPAPHLLHYFPERTLPTWNFHSYFRHGTCTIRCLRKGAFAVAWALSHRISYASVILLHLRSCIFSDLHSCISRLWMEHSFHCCIVCLFHFLPFLGDLTAQGGASLSFPFRMFGLYQQFLSTLLGIFSLRYFLYIDPFSALHTGNI